MDKIFGDFKKDVLSDQVEFLQLAFSPSSIPIQERWRNNGLSADFVADYLSTFFPASNDNPTARRRQAEIKSSVSYIANELLENAMKYNCKIADCPIKFGINLLHKEKVFVFLHVTNRVAPEQLLNFEAYIEEFLNSDSEELYFRKLEESAEDEGNESSGLGLITMKNDYDAKLGWRFETVNHEDETITNVTTMVQLEV